MTTKQAIISRLRARHRNARRVGIQTNDNAPSPAQRAAKAQRVEHIKQREAELKRLQREIPDNWLSQLIDAAKFTVDVEGDPVAVSQLAGALAIAQTRRDILEELKALGHERHRLTASIHRHKYDAYSDDDIGLCRFIIASADTLAELSAKIK